MLVRVFEIFVFVFNKDNRHESTKTINKYPKDIAKTIIDITINIISVLRSRFYCYIKKCNKIKNIQNFIQNLFKIKQQ